VEETAARDAVDHLTRRMAMLSATDITSSRGHEDNGLPARPSVVARDYHLRRQDHGRFVKMRRFCDGSLISPGFSPIDRLLIRAAGLIFIPYRRPGVNTPVIARRKPHPAHTRGRVFRDHRLDQLEV
jgi:hypothetical protein